MFSINSKETLFAIESTVKASLLVEQIQRDQIHSSITKGDLSPVTVADFASQALIGYQLQRAFPSHSMVAEEESEILFGSDDDTALKRITHYLLQVIPDTNLESIKTWIDFNQVDKADQFWTLDPIDGTKGFLRGDQYVVALAFISDGEVQIGVLGCPNLDLGLGKGSLVFALKGQGAYVSSINNIQVTKRIRVSPHTNSSQIRIMRSFESSHTNASKIDDLGMHLGLETEPVRLDSQAKYAVLASGSAEILLRLLSPSLPNYKEKIWDQAAGSIILTEAGGRVTDLDGLPLDFTQGRRLENNRGILATNAIIHDSVLEAIREIGA